MKILILTASTGGGHKSAAAALKEIIEKTDSSVEVKVADGLRYCGKIYNKFVCGGYLMLATKTPKLYGKLYNVSDQKSRINAICNSVNTHEGKKLVSLFNEIKPDVVISCHPFVTTMLSGLKQHKKITTPIVSLITDYTPHRTYIFPGIEAYITSSEKMTEEIAHYGVVSKDKIHPLGIPIANKFYVPTDTEKTARKLGFDQNVPTVLLMAGSFGVTEVLNFYESFMRTDINCQCIVITGRNKKLYFAFKKYLINKKLPQKPTKVFEFVNNVEEYMQLSNLIVTKPGGLTVTESLACSLPLAIYSAIPGQEEENAKYLKDENVAIILSKDTSVGGQQIAELLSSPEKLEEMKKNCEIIRKKQSALNIFKLCKSLVD